MNSYEKAKKYLPIAALILGIISLIMVFLPAVEISAMGMAEGCSGIKSIFGFKEYAETGEKIQIFGFSFGAMLPYLFGLIAGILAYVGAKKNNKICKIISAVLFLVAAVLFFCMIELIVIDEEAFQTQLTDAELELAIELFKGFMEISVGVVLGAICCIFGVIIVIVETFYDNLKKLFKETPEAQE